MINVKATLKAKAYENLVVGLQKTQCSIGLQMYLCKTGKNLMLNFSHRNAMSQLLVLYIL